MQRTKHIIANILIFAGILLACAATAQSASLPRCTSTKADGSPCKNYGYKDLATCYVHTPDIATAPRSTCGATTVSGTPCKARTAPNAKCHNHDDSADIIRCNATTAKGTKCTRPVKSVGTHCHQHNTAETK